MFEAPEVIDLGRMPYAAAYQVQCREHARVLASREAGRADATGLVGTILLVEHDPPVITISRREGARRHLVATEGQLNQAGVTIAETDRGGDITYHGPGQLVVYPILDLNRLRLGLHDYMRMLERAVIGVCRGFGVEAERDACATGVWVPQRQPSPGANGTATCATSSAAKICAMGVRVKRWITMHGLALNVTTNLDHFGLIVPCGLVGRSVTSLSRELGEGCPPMAKVKRAVVDALTDQIRVHQQAAAASRASGPS